MAKRTLSGKMFCTVDMAAEMCAKVLVEADARNKTALREAALGFEARIHELELRLDAVGAPVT